MQTSKKFAIGAIGLASAALSACGSGGHSLGSTVGFHESTVPTTSPTTVTPVVPTTNTSGGGRSADVTTGSGYVFKVSLASIGAQPTFTTDDGTGEGGTAVDAPPGSTIVVATLNFQNDSGRPELLPYGAYTLPAAMSADGVEMTVPVADANAFGIDATQEGTYCTTSAPATYAPLGYCNLDAKLGAYSPAQTDITQPSQVDSGGKGTVTLESDQSVSGAWVSQSAPVQDVKVFVQPNTTCTCWVQLG